MKIPVYLRKIWPVSIISVIFFLPFFINREDVLSVLSMAFLYGSIAYAWNIHALSGLISLGHTAFFGIGAYAAILISHYFKINLWFSLIFGGLLSTSYALMWYLGFYKLRHGAYTLATFAAAEVAKVIVDNWDSLTYGSSGINTIASLSIPIFHGDSSMNHYFIFATMAIFMTAVHYVSLNSTWGLALQAIRDNETTAFAIGIPVHWIRLVALIISSFVTGVCGSLYVYHLGYLEPSMVFNLHISAIPIVFAYFGGRFFTVGPLIGGLILYCFDQFVVTPLLPSAHQAIYGIIIIIVLWFLPEGISSWFTQKQRNA